MRKRVSTNGIHFAILSGCILLYLGVSLRNLEIIPAVYEDEPWQASTGWKLATQGVFGSDMFAGFYGMEAHYYGYMPVHPLLLAATYRVAGFGLFQTRLEAVTMGLLTLVLTYTLGRRLFEPSVGLLAVVLMLFVRLTGLTPSQISGILLLDMARIARYDMVVPVFGLASLHTYLFASRRSDLRLYAVAGLLAGLSGLSHLYGAFWIVALGLLAGWDQAGRQALVALALGFAAPWLLYLFYVLNHPADWVGQTRGYAPRFDLLNPRWYWDNLRNEFQRYGPGLGSPGWHYLLRPGFWVALVALPASLLALIRRAIRLGDRAARAIVVPALVIPALFALLIYLKLSNYLVTVLPLGALAVAWGGISCWRWAGRTGQGRWVRGVLAGILLAVITEGVTRMEVLEAVARTTTPYPDFIAQVRSHIPAHSRVLGLHHYWIGLHQLDYRSWAVPLLQADPRYFSPPRSIEVALEDIAPDVILIDPRMRIYFEDSLASDPQSLAIRSWMQRTGYAPVATVDDTTYGLMEIYQVER